MCFSADMRAFYCHHSMPNEKKNGPFGVIDTIRNPRKITGNKPRVTEVRTSIQVSHLYLARSARAKL